MSSGTIEQWNALAPQLLAFVRKRVAEKDEAKDIVQEVFLQFHERGYQLRNPDKLMGWIFRVARNKIIDFYRRERRTKTAEPEPPTDIENHYNQCVSDCLQEEIRSLPEKYRLPFEQVELKSVPQVAIAADLGLSYSGLKSRVQRAREMLRLRMESKYNIRADRYGNILVCENRSDSRCPEQNGEPDKPAHRPRR